MYCPKCFNDTLKLSSSGVVKLTFDGKAKTTSQFFYDLKKETVEETLKKLEAAVDEYFSWYSTFQNQDPVRQVSLRTSDFICQNRCSLGGQIQLSVVDLVVPKRQLVEILQTTADKRGIRLKLESLS